MKKTLCALALCGAFIPLANAGISSSLNDFFNDLGYSNVSNPNAYHGQAASYYNGGSLFVRTPIKHVQLASLTVPKISAGCGGIDMFMGGFSHINADEFVQFGKAIISNAVPFAIDLALQTWAPSFKEIRDNLQDAADMINAFSMDSCQTAQTAVTGLAAFASNTVKENLCASAGTASNKFQSWVAAQHECGTGGQTDEGIKAAKNDPALEDMTKTAHNLVWQSIMKTAFYRNDTQLAEFLMSISGTYIYDAEGKPRYYNSLLTNNENMLQSILNGGDLNYYRCDDTDPKKCLNPTPIDFRVPTESGLQEKVRNNLIEIYEALSEDKEISESQKAFIEYTDVPVFAIFKSALLANKFPEFEDYSRIISVRFLQRYFNEMLQHVESALRNTSIDPEDIKKILNSVDRARGFTDGYADEALEKIVNYEKIIQAHQLNDERFYKSMSSKLLENLNFN